MSYFGQLKRFDPISGEVPDSPFSYLPGIAWRARVLLKSRTAEQIDATAKAIDFAMSMHFDEILQDEIARLKNVLNRPRRWKREARQIEVEYNYAARFFNWEGEDSEDGQWLFNESLESELDIRTSQNTSELDALKQLDDWWNTLCGEAFPDGEPYELFAVLSLWLLADAISWLNPNKAHIEFDRALMSFVETVEVITGAKLSHKYSSNIKFAGDCALQAMDAVCFAEQLQEVKRIARDYSQKEVMQHEQARKQRSLRGQELNIARHQKTNEAKNQVIKEWEREPSKFASVEKAGLHFSDLLAKQGKSYEPRTVSKWIRDYAKTLGVRLR